MLSTGVCRCRLGLGDDYCASEVTWHVFHPGSASRPHYFRSLRHWLPRDVRAPWQVRKNICGGGGAPWGMKATNRSADGLWRTTRHSEVITLCRRDGRDGRCFSTTDVLRCGVYRPVYHETIWWHVYNHHLGQLLHLSMVAKSSTSFGWGKGRKVTAVGWQVIPCDLIWHVISCSSEVIHANCYIRFTSLYLL